MFKHPMESTENETARYEPVELIPDGFCNKQYINKSKVRDSLIREYAAKKPIVLNVAINRNVHNLVDVITRQEITLSSYDITEQDLMILDAAYSLYAQGFNPMSLEQIVQQYAGYQNNTETDKISRAVAESIKKMQKIYIKIDWKEEAAAYKKENAKKDDLEFVFEGYLMPVEIVRAKYASNGKQVKTAYNMLAAPALYRYAKGNRQIMTIPSECLHTTKYFSNTEEAVIIKRYIVRRVMEIISDNKLHSNRISLFWHDGSREKNKGLLARLGYQLDNSPGGRKKKARITKIVKGTLETMKEQGHITGYEAYRERNSKSPSVPVAGFEIYYTKKKQGTR